MVIDIIPSEYQVDCNGIPRG